MFHIIVALLALASANAFPGDFSTLADNTWTRIADCPGDAMGREVPPGRGATWVYDPNSQKFLRFGGYTPTYSNAVDEFDPATKTWKRLFAHDETYPDTRPGGGCRWMLAYDSTRHVIWMAGGWHTTGPTGHMGVWTYDPVAKTFTRIGDPLSCNTFYAFDQANDVIVASPPIPAWSGYTRTTPVFDISRSQWDLRSTDSIPQAYYEGRYECIYDPSIGKVVLIKNSATWFYDAASNQWSEVATTGAPPDKILAAMAYDPVNQVVFRYGGSDGRRQLTYVNETWIFKGSTRTWTRLSCPGIPVNAESKGNQPLFYHQAIAYYPPQNCFLMSDPDLGVWAFKYNPASPMGTEVVDAESLVVGKAAGNAAAEGPSDVLRAFNTPLNDKFLDMAENTLLRLESMASGDEIRWYYDPDQGIILKYGGCGNGNSPFWGGYGNSMVVYDPGIDAWFAKRTGDVSGINRPGNGCGRSHIYDSNRKQWWFFGGVSGEPYPCLAPQANGPWSYDFANDRFTGHNIASAERPYLEGGINLAYDPEHDVTVVPDADSTTWEFDFTTLLWLKKANTGGPGALAEHAGNIAWVPTLHSFLCFSGGKTWAYNPEVGRWVDLAPSNPPPAREVKMGLAYDSRNNIVLLVAGYLTWNENPVNDMWAYHPGSNAWEALNPPDAADGSRPVNGCQQTAYDSRHNVFFIGMESSDAMFAYRYKVVDLGTEKKAAAAVDNTLAVSPNPFNPSVRIRLQGNHEKARISIFAPSGGLVSRFNTEKDGVEWNASQMPSGVYLIQAETGTKTLRTKAILLK